MLDLGLLLLRVVVGGLLAAHGLRKVAGWWGGPGPDGNAAFLRSLGYRWPQALSRLHGGIEVAAGVLLVLGLMTPIAAGAVVAVMLNAIMAFHATNGLWATDSGIEYPLMLATAAGALAMAGPGAVAVDPLLGFEVTSTWAAAGVIGGLAIGLAGLALRRPATSREDGSRPLRAA